MLLPGAVTAKRKVSVYGHWGSDPLWCAFCVPGVISLQPWWLRTSLDCKAGKIFSDQLGKIKGWQDGWAPFQSFNLASCVLFTIFLFFFHFSSHPCSLASLTSYPSALFLQSPQFLNANLIHRSPSASVFLPTCSPLPNRTAWTGGTNADQLD